MCQVSFFYPVYGDAISQALGEYIKEIIIFDDIFLRLSLRRTHIPYPFQFFKHNKVYQCPQAQLQHV